MKNILKTLVFIFGLFLFSGKVNAEEINSITMDIYIDEYGTAHVTEVWDAYPTSKTEYYHAYHNLGNSKIDILSVKDETREYSLKEWNINDSFNEKAYKYGYNYQNNGVEICFGKSSYKNNIYTIEYTITNFVSKVDDADIIYFNLLDSIKPAPKNVEITIYSSEYFSSNLSVWGYGNYGNETSVTNGKIHIKNLNEIKETDYFVILAKFPLNTFKIENKLEGNFDKYLKMAEEGAKPYTEDDWYLFIFSLLITVIWMIPFIIIMIVVGKKVGNKKIDYGINKPRFKNVEMFREIPFGKDLAKAYWLVNCYNLTNSKTNYFGALLLKWIKEDKVMIQDEVKNGIFKKNNYKIILKQNLVFESKQETNLYNYIYEASIDGILENKEFEKWCMKNTKKIKEWFDSVLDSKTSDLEKEGYLVLEKTKKLVFFTREAYVVQSKLYEDAKKLVGLRKFFKNIDNMKDKEVIDVKIWEEYLMYAQILGMADKVAKQFKELYPDVITDETYNSLLYVSTVSHSSITSSGYSSGGGGGGSFGGGGGGSR